MAATATARTGSSPEVHSQRRSFLRQAFLQRQLILMVIPGLLIVFIFNYIPMYGVIIAFEKYNPVKGYFGSEWVGLLYFKQFFSNSMSFQIIRNTLLLGLFSLIWSFPAPIFLALLLDQLQNVKFKKIVQTISYFPYFISTVIIVGLLKQMLSIDGVLNILLQRIGFDQIPFLTDASYFRSIFISSGIWQGIGFGSIIYLAALTNVDPQLIESAMIDGANRFQRVWYISIPAILPTMIILLIFSISGILGSDFQKVLLLYNPANYSTSDVISTYVFRQGIQGGSFEFASAVGLFTSVLSTLLIIITNRVAKSVSEYSLW
jgi:putative aldouronate transport system permease protein